jgi:hypothetical protein
VEEAVANHWCGSVRERAKEALGALPEGESAPPKVIQIAMWRRVKEIAGVRFPKMDFTGRMIVRK